MARTIVEDYSFDVGANTVTLAGVDGPVKAQIVAIVDVTQNYRPIYLAVDSASSALEGNVLQLPYGAMHGVSSGDVLRITYDTSSTWSSPPGVGGAVSTVEGRTGDVDVVSADIAGLASVATSGAYVDLTGKPTIPSTLAALDTTVTGSQLNSDHTKLAGVATGATANDTDANLKARVNHTGTQTADTVTDGTTNKAFLATERTKLTGVATGATANSTDVTLLARGNHTGTQSADTLTDGTTNKAFLATERTKLSGVATAATANSSDATLLARANHTGTQAASTISDFDAAVLVVKPVTSLIRQHTTYTLPNDTNLNKLFNGTANGRLTLPVGTYEFRSQISLAAMSATSGNSAFSVLGAGSAVLANQLIQSIGMDGSGLAAALTGSMVIGTSITWPSMQTGGTNQNQQALLWGTFEVTTAGTIIPSLQQVTAAAAQLAPGSFFEVWRLCATTDVFVGAWD